MSHPKAYKDVSDFLSALDENSNPEGSGSDFSLFFTRGDGGVALSADEARAYLRVLNSLREHAGEKKYLTPRILERLLQEAILSILYSGPPSSHGRRTAVTAALRTLKKEISRQPEPWTVYLSVTGATVGSRQVEFGRVRFHRKRGRFESAVMREAEALIAKSTDTRNSKDDLCAETRKRLDELQAGGCVAEVTVHALDGEGAEIEARHIASEVGAVLSFFGEVLNGHSASIRIGEPPEGKVRNAIAIREGASVSHRSAAVGRGALLSLNDLKSSRRQRLQGRWVSRVLSKTDRNSNEERLLSAIVWCGRALLQDRREMQFLLYAISLETLLLGRKEMSELGYRLRSRAAHLLSHDIVDRESISSDLSKLYKARSKIVHAGSEDIPDAQLRLIRSYAIGAIMTCIMNPDIRKMPKDADLERWFERKILM